MELQVQLKHLHKKLDSLINQETEIHLEEDYRGIDKNDTINVLGNFIKKKKANTNVFKHICKNIFSRFTGLFSKLRKKISGKHLEGDMNATTNNDAQKYIDKLTKLNNKMQDALDKDFTKKLGLSMLGLLMLMPLFYLVGIHIYYFMMNQEVYMFEGFISVFKGLQSVTENISKTVVKLSKIEDMKTLMEAVISVLLLPIRIPKDFFKTMYRYQEDRHIISITAEFTTVFVMIAGAVIISMVLLGLYKGKGVVIVDGEKTISLEKE